VKLVLFAIFILVFFIAVMIFFMNFPFYPDSSLISVLICILVSGLNYMFIRFLSPINKDAIKICLITLLLTFSLAFLADRFLLILIEPAFH
jgi:hypothetical protein